MALEKTKLLVEIEAKTNNASRGIEEVSDGLENLGNEALKSSSKAMFAIQQLENHVSRLARQVSGTQGITQAIALDGAMVQNSVKALDSVSRSMKSVDGHAVGLSKSLATAGKTNSSYNFFLEVTNRCNGQHGRSRNIF